MTEPVDDWGARNRQYAAAVVDWVWAKQERAAAHAAAAARPRARRWWWCRPRRAARHPDWNRQVDEAAAAMTALAGPAEDPHPPALVALDRPSGCPSSSGTCCGCAPRPTWTGRSTPCAARPAVPDPVGRPRPVRSVQPAPPGADAVRRPGPGRPLRGGLLVQVAHPDGGGLLTTAIRLDPRVLAYFLRADEHLGPHGEGLDHHLAGFGEVLRWPEGEVGDDRKHAAARLAALWPATPPPSGNRPAHLIGPDAEGKRVVTAEAGRLTHRRVFRLPIDRVPAADAEVDAAARRLGRVRGPVAVAADPGARTGEPPERIVVHPAAVRDQELAWAAALKVNPGTWLTGSLAAQFDLDASAIREIGAALLAATESSCGKRPERAPTSYWKRLHREVVERCNAATRPQTGDLAQRLAPPPRWQPLADRCPKWEDLGLYLPADVTRQLDELVAQVENRWRVYDHWGLRERHTRGLGVTALFTGEGGTGKTTAAEAVAFRLGLDVYRVDLSAVIDKYIGETEKNLRRVFDAFEPGGAVLFFDECDALFGKRTEVRDSRDRYANVETSYLLQRLESYRGLAVLATNHPGEVDAAFVRRLRFIVPFRPAEGQWAALWRYFLLDAGYGGHGPKVAGVDDQWLAGFVLTGGSIQSAAMRALFLAARTSPGVVTWEHVEAAVEAEYEKLRLPVPTFDPPRPAAARRVGAV